MALVFKCWPEVQALDLCLGILFVLYRTGLGPCVPPFLHLLNMRAMSLTDPRWYYYTEGWSWL